MASTARRRDPCAATGRRGWLLSACAATAGLIGSTAQAQAPTQTQQRGRRAAQPLTVCTFGDSVLDCGRYNDRGLTPGALLVRNDDELFPEFKGRDLQSRGPAVLDHRAVDGATVDSLAAQLNGFALTGTALALLSVGGNDLLRGLAADNGPGIGRFERALERFVRRLPVRPVLFATVYDPTCGDDRQNFLGVPAPLARANHRRVNSVIGEIASRHGRLVDLHAHFLLGEPSWFTRTIEPSLVGASEVRRAFLEVIGPPR